MAPVKPHEQEVRKRACLEVLELLDGSAPTATTPAAISNVKGLYTRVYKQDQWDWFTVWRQLRRPGIGQSRRISAGLADLRSAVMAEDAAEVGELISGLEHEGLRYQLAGFPALHGAMKQGYGCVYVLSTREQREILKVGYTNRSVEERVKAINSATGVVIPYGVRGMWYVRDAPQTEAAIHQLLAPYRIRSDREFFQLDFREAFRLIRDYLSDRQI